MAHEWHGASQRSAGLADEAWNDEAVSLPVNTDGILAPVADEENSCILTQQNCIFEHGDSGSGILQQHEDSTSGSGVSLVDVLPPVIIAEVFKHLDARSLSVVSCVCSLFYRLSSDSHGWKVFYCERWGNPVASVYKDATPVLSENNWKDLYVARELRSKAFLGRYRTDMMNGHTKAIRCVRLLSPANLIFTAGYDSILRIWDLEEGLPVTWSRPLGDTVRAIAVDMCMLVVGGTDAKLRIWRAVPDLPHIFDVAGVMPHPSETILSRHDGPITSLGLDETKICSGSWDMTVRVWDRSSLECVRTLMHRDWVWALSLRGQRLVSTAGGDVYSWDAETGECLKVRVGAHVGQAYAVECSRSGHFVFSGGEDGFIRMFEEKGLRRRRTACRELVSTGEPFARWQPHSGAVHALAFDDPWLVSASGDGSLAMMDIRKVIKNSEGRRSIASPSVKSKSRWAPCAVASTDTEPPQRMLFGSNQSFYSVDIGADRVISAGEEKIVKVWDFTLALEIERRVQASKIIRLEQRIKRKQIAQQHKGKEDNAVFVLNASREVIDGGPVWHRSGIKLRA